MALHDLSLAAALKRVKELERELATLRASVVEADSDAAYIREVLGEDLLRATRVRTWREPHPFGSSVAREALAEAELPSEIAIDPDDVQTLPRRVRLNLKKEGAELAVTVRLRTDAGRRVVYAVEED
jgi:hypothetical protein